MTTANVSVKQILLKRGTTAKNLAYTGPAGEVTIDTDLDTLRIHDGVTPGGNVVGGGGGVSSAVTNAINANVAAANVQITSLWANAAAQATSITSLSANIVAANSAIVTANVRMKSYVDTQISGISLTPGPQGPSANQELNTTDNVVFNKVQANNTVGVPAPDGSTDKFTLWDGSEGYNYAIGVENNHTWFAVDVQDGGHGFKWYAGGNELLTLTDQGALTWLGGNATIQSGQGFHISNEGSIDITAVDTTDPEDLKYRSLTIGTDGRITLPSNYSNAINNSSFIQPDVVNLVTAETTGNAYAISYQGNKSWEVYAEDDITGAHGAWSWIKTELTDINHPVTFIENQRATDGSNVRWAFGDSGNLILPQFTSSPAPISSNVGIVFGDGTWQNTAWIEAAAISDTAPTNPKGRMWFNTIDARLYVKYNTQWVDASPAVIPPTSTYTGELVIDGTRISNTDYTGSKDVEIENADSVWKFTGTGVLEIPASIKFPDNTVQTTAWNSSSLLEIDGGDASTWLTA